MSKRGQEGRGDRTNVAGDVVGAGGDKERVRGQNKSRGLYILETCNTTSYHIMDHIT